MSIRLRIADPEAMEALGARIARELRAGDAVLLTGELGAGKTTFTRGLGATLGVRGTVTSPTFVLARTHPREGGGAPLVHVDAHRLADAAELDDLDIDFAASIVVVEWGAGLLEHLVDEWLSVAIVRPMGAGIGVPDSDADDAPIEPREVVIEGVGERWADLGWLHAAGD